MSEPIWEGTVDDNTWRVQVIDAEQPGHGTLTVVRISDGLVILREDATLAYGAIFGPDVDDVSKWQYMAIEAIDHYNAHHGKDTQDGRDQGRQGTTDQDL